MIHSIDTIKLIKSGCIALLLITLANTLQAQSKITQARFSELQQMENVGVKLFKKDKYEKAYKKLILPAKKGLKQSQYLIGFMYLKGLHVDQSLVEGLAWLGVAKEADVVDWSATYDSVYRLTTESQQAEIKTLQALYIKSYGLEAQQLDCNSHRKPGSRRIVIECVKRVISQIKPFGTF
ncbi:MAG: TPR repeat protein [Candidatus Azotimanducaceae bacterium]|jgi:TPR repeat protein